MGSQTKRIKRLPVIAAANPVGLSAPLRDEQLWRRIYREDARRKQGGRCAYCGSEIARDEATADHAKARKHGGLTSNENINAACAPCNLAKGSMTVRRFKKDMRSPPPGARPAMLNAYVRWQINRMADDACKRIAKFAGVPL